MIVINIETVLKNAEKLKEKSSSIKILMDSLSILKFNKSNWCRKIIFALIEIGVSVIIVLRPNTISLMQEIIREILTVVIALLAIVFTGYALFQALINNKMLIALLSVEKKQGGNLYMTNKYFANVMIFQLVCILIDLIVLILLIIMPEMCCLFSNHLYNEIFTVIFISIVLCLNFESIWEMKSFIFNVFQLFNMHAYSRIIEMIESEKKNRK